MYADLDADYWRKMESWSSGKSIFLSSLQHTIMAIGNGIDTRQQHWIKAGKSHFFAQVLGSIEGSGVLLHKL
jgi:hypothetical protein